MTTYALFDLASKRALATHESYTALAALHYIQFANVDGQIIRLGENKNFSCFDADFLRNTLLQLGVPTNEIPPNYGDLVKAARHALENTHWLVLPFPLEQLQQQAFALNCEEAGPYAFDPSSPTTPERRREWSGGPQQNRKRKDSTFAINFSAGCPAPSGAAAPIAAKPASPPRPGLPAAPPSPSKPKAPRAPAAAGKVPSTPKPGTSSAQVWDAADAVLEGQGSKVHRKQVIEHCVSLGINASTASVQYGHWKSSKGL